MGAVVRDLTASDLKLFGNIVSRLSRLSPEEDIRATVLDDILTLTRADFVASFVWNSEKNCYEQAMSRNMDPGNLNRYNEWFQFRDPMTRQLHALQRAAHVEEVIERREMLRTEFFNDFLSVDGLDHGVNIYFVDNGRDLGDLRIWRRKGRPEFSEREISLLDALSPFLTSALKRHKIVCDGLTPREIEIANLISSGFRDLEIAERLGIAFGTVRTHVNKLLEKRGCVNRSELAAMYARMGA